MTLPALIAVLTGVSLVGGAIAAQRGRSNIKAWMERYHFYVETLHWRWWAQQEGDWTQVFTVTATDKDGRQRKGKVNVSGGILGLKADDVEVWWDDGPLRDVD